MDTLSASVSSLNLPSLPPQPKPPLRSVSRCFKGTVNAAASTNLSSSPSSYFLRAISKHSKAPASSSPSPPPPVHEKAASGFAAALVSVCQSKNCLGRTQKDVRRLMEFLVEQENKMNNKVFLVKDVVERGKFGKHLKGLVNLLVAKGKSDILVDVMMEFERICNELVVVVGTTKLVSVS